MRQKRKRATALTLSMFTLLFVIMLLSPTLEALGKKTVMLDYLSAAAVEDGAGGFGLAAEGFETTGVSADRRVLGYHTAMEPAAAMRAVDSSLAREGWVCAGFDGQGVATYALPAGKGGAGCGYALVIACAQGNGTSIVVELV